MTDREQPIAREVHTLLLSANPASDDLHLAKAAELTSPEKTTARPSDDFRADACLAIQKVWKAIFEGASEAERKRLLLHAVVSARSWLNARS